MFFASGILLTGMQNRWSNSKNLNEEALWAFAFYNQPSKLIIYFITPFISMDSDNTSAYTDRPSKMLSIIVETINLLQINKISEEHKRIQYFFNNYFYRNMLQLNIKAEKYMDYLLV